MTLPIDVAASLYPSEVAFDDGETQLHYGELDQSITELIGKRLSGVQPGDHVAWCPQNDLDAFVTFWALQKLGCVTCPVSHRFPQLKRLEILKQIDAIWLEEQSLARSRVVMRADQEQEFEVENRPATMILTSGSTGAPKAVMHTMQAHQASAQGAADNMPLGPRDRWLWSLPLCHVSGLSILIRCSVAGATVVGVRPKMKPTAELLDDLKVSHVSLVSIQLRRLLDQASFPSKHLKHVLLGGSAVDSQLVTDARRRGIRVCTTYGLTEMASQVTTSSYDGNPEASGRLLQGRQIKLSESGEIWVKGETLCLGYYQASEIRSIVDEEGWFRTGDLGNWTTNGELLVRGRIDNMFVSGGENIYPETIERAMLNKLGLSQVVVVPRSCESFGARPVALIQGELPKDWQAVLRSLLKGYELPVTIYEWPANNEGDIKPNRQAMKELVGTAANLSVVASA